MNLYQASALIQAAIAESEGMRLQPLSVVVLSADGTVRASISQTGVAPARFAIARGKAEGALKLRHHSRQLAEMAEERPGFFASLYSVEDLRGIVTAAGAILIKGTDGDVAGSIGISGDTSDNDEACAIAAVRSVGMELWQ